MNNSTHFCIEMCFKHHHLSQSKSHLPFLQLTSPLCSNHRPPLLQLPGKNAINIGLATAMFAAGAVFMGTDPSDVPAAVTALAGAGLVAGVLGAHLTASIGGADMPVVITLLNSYSGKEGRLQGALDPVDPRFNLDSRAWHLQLATWTLGTTTSRLHFTLGPQPHQDMPWRLRASRSTTTC